MKCNFVIFKFVEDIEKSTVSGISKKMNPDDFFQRLVKNAKDICEGSNFTYKVDIVGRKVSYFNDDFRPTLFFSI